MTHPNHERGGVLLYAVIAVAFLSGLSLYVKNIFENQKKIFLFSKENVLIASASKTSGNIYNTDITTELTDTPSTSVITYAKLNYDTRSISDYINKKLTISISINPL